jgi:4-hydroxy-2-oxoheptanedioate aldolase
MYINTAKRLMMEGKPAFGASCVTGSRLAAELMARAGFDFVLLDDQHGLCDPTEITASFHSIHYAGAVPMARVRKNDFAAIGALLDRGAMGIVAPLVNSVEDAKAAAYAMRYPPRGGRSFGPVGCIHYGPDYADWANDEVFLAVQIESQQAVEQVDEIMAVDGVDGCWIGPNDLGRSMGLDLSQPSDAEAHQAAIRRTLEASQMANKIPGIAYGPTKQLIAQGFLFLTPASDLGILGQTSREVLADLRGS